MYRFEYIISRNKNFHSRYLSILTSCIVDRGFFNFYANIFIRDKKLERFTFLARNFLKSFILSVESFLRLSLFATGKIYLSENNLEVENDVENFLNIILRGDDGSILKKETIGNFNALSFILPLICCKIWYRSGKWQSWKWNVLFMLKKKLWKYINHSQNERNVRNEYEIYIIIISN